MEMLCHSGKKIAVIIGTSRPSRIGANVTNWVIGKLPKNDDVAYEVIDLAEWNLPLLDEILPPMMGQYGNEHTKKWSAKISEFDGFLVVSEFVVTENRLQYLAWIGHG